MVKNMYDMFLVLHYCQFETFLEGYKMCQLNYFHFPLQCNCVINMSEILSKWWFSVLTVGINVKTMM